MNLWYRLGVAPAIAGVFACVLVTGCATPQVLQIQGLTTVTVAPKVGPLNTPFIAQEQYECGPAALAMAMRSAGLDISADDLTSQVYLPGRQGALQVEMLATTRRHGLLGYPLKPHLQAVFQEVAAGNPVIVFQNLSLPVYPVWHYAVVIGYDIERNVIILHSGLSQRMEMSLFTFERTWARGGYWAIVALPTTTLPATAAADDLALAAAALESINPAAAHVVYEAALTKWPQGRPFLLGRGNSSYAQHDLEKAAIEYRQAVTKDPDFADGWNNLAQVLLNLQRRVESREAISRAIAIGGPRLTAYESLLAQIEAQ